MGNCKVLRRFKYNTAKEIIFSVHANQVLEQRKNKDIRKIITNQGLFKKSICSAFVVDKGHENGLENHIVLKSGVVIILNATTNKFVTFLFARPGQIRRYYDSTDGFIPEYLMKAALKNFKKKKHLT